MSPPRRRSARIASSSKTPLKASTLPRLGSVIEGEEEPVQQPIQSLDTVMSSPVSKPRTPASAAPVKLPMSEMHPSRVHQTMAPPASGLKFGFVDINPDERSRDHPSGINQTTPSKTRAPSSDFTFRVASPMGGELDLGPEARQMMEQLREKAAKKKTMILADLEKQQLEAKSSSPFEASQTPEERPLVQPKGKMGRFSAAHMREFKKMDSILVRTPVTIPRAPNLTPFKPGMKRSQSKANLDETESSARKTRSERPTPRVEKQPGPPKSITKRVRQRIEDDVSALRPVSRDGSHIPRPKSSGSDSVRNGIPRSQTVANLTTPTKPATESAVLTKTPSATLAKSSSKSDLIGSVKPSHKSGLSSLVRSPTRPDLSSFLKSPSKSAVGGSLKKSATTNSLNVPRAAPSLVQTPGRFDRVKSILKRQFSASKPKSHLPQAASFHPKTPGRTEKQLPAIPMTTPGQKFSKHVDFTPDTKQAALSQNSPSPTKSSIPRSKTLPKLPAPKFQPLAAVLSAKKPEREVAYPDLSAYVGDADSNTEIAAAVAQEPSMLPDGVPGTFTFRSDHTIRFNSVSPTGFGGAAGQASLRAVRSSIAPVSRMPGAFPAGNEASSPNKENKDPGVSGIAHGMSNKKRHRAVWDDEEIKSGISHGISNKKRHRADSDDETEQDEGTQRGAKKLRKGPAVAEGHALVAPTLSATPSPMKKQAGISHTPSPQKKGISLSRLNMLARPKNRK